MAGTGTHSHQDRALRKNLSSERALHRWDKWLYSIANGREVLRSRYPHPSLEEMMSAAKEALTEMKFPPCVLLEVYWLCCVFADYEADGFFYFDNLVLPDWFPSCWSDGHGMTFDFEGKRIYPPEIWDEADRKFWLKRSRFKYDRDFILVLPSDHAVRKYIKRGRPTTTGADGRTLLE